MKGIVSNLLGDLVTHRYGAETWDTLLERAGVDGAYTSLGNYSDAELAELFRAASHAVGRRRSRPSDGLVVTRYLSSRRNIRSSLRPIRTRARFY